MFNDRASQFLAVGFPMRTAKLLICLLGITQRGYESWPFGACDHKQLQLWFGVVGPIDSANEAMFPHGGPNQALSTAIARMLVCPSQSGASNQAEKLSRKPSRKLSLELSLKPRLELTLKLSVTLGKAKVKAKLEAELNVAFTTKRKPIARSQAQS